MLKPVTLGIVGLSCLVALLATDRIALGQAGSIGGTIGKTDKSVSGGEEETPGGRKSGHRNAAAAPASISGKWSWRAKCENGDNYTGEFDFDQNADGTLSGNCSVITGPNSCGALSGHVAGKKAMLRVLQKTVIGAHETTYELTVAADGQSMQGTEHAWLSGECTYQVKRLSRRTE
jgi:hypothetical protein